MSMEVREELVSKLIFQDEDSKSDLLNPQLTDTELINVLMELLDEGHRIEITAVRTDHHPDGYLGVHSHQVGRAVDCWPLNSLTAGDYADENGMTFSLFLSDLRKDPLVAQVGLGGSAFTVGNMKVLGPLGFQDNGADHVHIGV
jgi:hypothetical protein